MKNSLLIVPLDLLGQAPPRLRILPAGRVELRDSREAFEVRPADMARLIEVFTGDGVDLVIDWEHRSLSGERAPAAAWMKGLEAEPDGLYARVEWTPQGRADVESGSYRYHSPVLRLDPETRRPLKLLHAGLTNTPAIKGLPELLAAKYGEEAEILVMKNYSSDERAQMAKNGQAMPDGSFPIVDREDLKNAVQSAGRAQDPAAAKKHIMARAKAMGMMDMMPADWTKKMEEGKPMMNRLLGLPGLTVLKADATEDEIIAALTVRLELAEALPEIAQAAGLAATATAAQVKGAVLALKQGTEQFADLQREVTALKAESAQGKAQKLVDEALAAKKITPAQRDWALKYAADDPEGFKSFADKAPAILPSTELKVKTQDGKGEVALTENELVMCRTLNITPEAFKASKESLAAGQA